VAAAVLGVGAIIGTGVAIGTNGSSAPEPGFADLPFAGEPDVDLADVPAWVIHTAKVALPKAEFKTAQLDQDDLLAIYEVQGTNDGKAVEVDVRPDGSVQEIELVIDAKDVPEAAAAKFASLFPKFELVKIEKSIRPSETGLLSVWYEWDGTPEGGDPVDVEIDSTGSTYLVEPD
jgi:hypothetical protein